MKRIKLFIISVVIATASIFTVNSCIPEDDFCVTCSISYTYYIGSQAIYDITTGYYCGSDLEVDNAIANDYSYATYYTYYCY